jgi:hypothetical protein
MQAVLTNYTANRQGALQNAKAGAGTPPIVARRILTSVNKRIGGVFSRSFKTPDTHTGRFGSQRRNGYCAAAFKATCRKHCPRWI